MKTGPSIAIVLVGMACWYAVAETAKTDAPSAPSSPPVEVDEVDAAWRMDVTPHESLKGEFTYLGTASCAASNCHGGDRSGGNRPAVANDGHRGRDATWGGEYSIWLHQDPHAHAYDVLFDDLSVTMAEKLGLEEGAHRSNRCLNCHAVNVHIENPGTDADFRTTHTDGVGCEACHGPAGDWLDLHKQQDWSRLTSAEKAEHGFWDTDDVLTRTRICASCHVGGPGRDVDHDLIAAGHPRLNFEMSGYQSMLPKHWNEAANLVAAAPAGVSEEGPLKAAFEAKLWAVGQVVSARASVDQTIQRARDVNGHRVWPEFTEYGCYACHHDLSLDPEIGGADDAAFRSWRQARGFPNRRAGRLPWNTWYTPGLPWLAENDAEATRLRQTVEEARRVLEKPRPVRELSAVSVESLADELDAWAVELNEMHYDGTPDSPFGSKWRDHLREVVAGDARYASRESWDAATQVWLALAALERSNALEGRPNDRLRNLLVDIRAKLEFPDDPERVSSPRDFGRSLTGLDEDFRKVQETVGVEGK